MARLHFFAVLFLALLLGGCGGGSTQNPQPDTSGGPQPSNPPGTVPRSPIRHVIVLILQNRSFDHLFGRFPGADGIREGVPGFSQLDAAGNPVTPYRLTDLSTTDVPHDRNSYLRAWNNGAMDKYALANGPLSMGYYDGDTPGVALLWRWAQEYALADRYFASVMGNAPANPLYMTAASDNGDPSTLSPAFGPCNDDGNPQAPAFDFPNVGTQLSDAGYDWMWFSDGYPDCTVYLPWHNPFQYFTATQGTPHLASFNRFRELLQSSDLPEVTFLDPAPWQNMRPGNGSVATNAEYVDSLLNDIKNSPAWDDTAVIVTFDESGGWWDHVPPPQLDSQGLGARVPMMVISPFAKRGHISHVQMDHVSILNFIQWNWGLASLNDRNRQSNNMLDMFQF